MVLAESSIPAATSSSFILNEHLGELADFYRSLLAHLLLKSLLRSGRLWWTFTREHGMFEPCAQSYWENVIHSHWYPVIRGDVEERWKRPAGAKAQFLTCPWGPSWDHFSPFPWLRCWWETPDSNSSSLAYQLWWPNFCLKPHFSRLLHGDSNGTYLALLLWSMSSAFFNPRVNGQLQLFPNGQALVSLWECVIVH